MILIEKLMQTLLSLRLLSCRSMLVVEGKIGNLFSKEEENMRIDMEILVLDCMLFVTIFILN